MIFSTRDNISYKIDPYGVVHQLNPEPFEYDKDYVSIYDTPEYEGKASLLNGIRMGLVMGISNPVSVLDIGYGNGSFLNCCRGLKIKSYGIDVSGVDVPYGCYPYKDYYYNVDVVCYWDSFEHIPNLAEEMNRWASKFVFISLPDLEAKDFDNWKHRKPNEHLHHFTLNSITQMVETNTTYNLVHHSHLEDLVRGSASNNILTVVFEDKRK